MADKEHFLKLNNQTLYPTAYFFGYYYGGQMSNPYKPGSTAWRGWKDGVKDGNKTERGSETFSTAYRE